MGPLDIRWFGQDQCISTKHLGLVPNYVRDLNVPSNS
jgi:hypothetical protein